MSFPKTTDDLLREAREAGLVDVSTSIGNDLLDAEARRERGPGPKDRAIASMMRRNGFSEADIQSRFGYKPAPLEPAPATPAPARNGRATARLPATGSPAGSASRVFGTLAAAMAAAAAVAKVFTLRKGHVPPEVKAGRFKATRRPDAPRKKSGKGADT